MTMTITTHELPPLRYGAIRPLPTLSLIAEQAALALDTDSAAVTGPCAVCLRANADLLWGCEVSATAGAIATTKRLPTGDREWYEIPAGVSIVFRATAA